MLYFPSIPSFDERTAWNRQDIQISPPAVACCKAGPLQTAYKPLAPDLVVHQTAYKLNMATDMFELIKYDSKGKATIQPLTCGFQISTYFRYVTESGQLLSVFIRCQTRYASEEACVPATDVHTEKYRHYFDKISKCAGCKPQQFNALFAYQLQITPYMEIILFSHAGWHQTQEGKLIFAANAGDSKIHLQQLPRSILKRRIPLKRETREVLNEWLRHFANDPVMQFLIVFRMGAVLSPYLKAAGVHFRLVPVVRPSVCFDENKLIAIMSSVDATAYSIYCLCDKESDITGELADSWDGVTVFVHRGTLDDSRTLTGALAVIEKAVLQTGPQAGRTHAAIVAEAAEHIAGKFAPDLALAIDTGKCKCVLDADHLRVLAGEMECAMITAICSVFDSFDAQHFTDFVNKLRVETFRGIDEPLQSVLIMVFCVNRVLCMAFGVQLFTNENYQALKKVLADRQVSTADDLIITECSSILSDRFRSGTFSVLNKKKNALHSLTAYTALIEGERILLSQEMLDDVLKDMKTTKKKRMLLRALRQSGLLYATDGDCHCIRLHIEGRTQSRINMYDIPISLLDIDIIDDLLNIHSADYWLSVGEIPDSDFQPLLMDSRGRVAGRLIRYSIAENNSVSVTGQSGLGKSFFMEQQAAFCFELGHRVILLDCSGSFTDASLRANLSDAFVDDHVEFLDLDQNGVPFNLFEFDRTANHSLQCGQIYSALKAAIGQLDYRQSARLQAAVSDALKALTEAETLRPCSILNRLSGEDETTVSLRFRLEPILNLLSDLGMSTMTCADYLHSRHKITVLQTKAPFTETGAAFFDMIIGACFRTQKKRPDIPLDLFLDEIQMQNLSTNTPIRQVLSQSRKSHMALYFATQDVSARGTSLGKTQGQASVKVFFRPTSNSEGVAASELRFHKADFERFDALGRGEAIISGGFYSKRFRQNVQQTLQGEIVRWSPTTVHTATRALPVDTQRGQESNE